MDPTKKQASPNSQILIDQYWEALVDCGYDNEEGPYIARFGRLSHLNLAYLFNELIQVKANIRSDGTTNQQEMERLGVLLHQYSKYWES